VSTRQNPMGHKTLSLSYTYGHAYTSVGSLSHSLTLSLSCHHRARRGIREGVNVIVDRFDNSPFHPHPYNTTVSLDFYVIYLSLIFFRSCGGQLREIPVVLPLPKIHRNLS